MRGFWDSAGFVAARSRRRDGRIEFLGSGNSELGPKSRRPGRPRASCESAAGALVDVSVSSMLSPPSAAERLTKLSAAREMSASLKGPSGIFTRSKSTAKSSSVMLSIRSISAIVASRVAGSDCGGDGLHQCLLCTGKSGLRGSARSTDPSRSRWGALPRDLAWRGPRAAPPAAWRVVPAEPQIWAAGTGAFERGVAVIAVLAREDRSHAFIENDLLIFAEFLDLLRQQQGSPLLAHADAAMPLIL